MKSKDPFFLSPDIFNFLNISGGRSSAFMLRKILDRYEGELPEGSEAVFCNTGKEHPATLDFVRDISLHWGVKIIWLEYAYQPERKGTVKDPRHVHIIVNHETASRDGKPFDDLIRARKTLPSIFRRFCTQDLKVNTILTSGSHSKRFSTLRASLTFFPTNPELTAFAEIEPPPDLFRPLTNK